MEPSRPRRLSDHPADTAGSRGKHDAESRCDLDVASSGGEELGGVFVTHGEEGGGSVKAGKFVLTRAAGSVAPSSAPSPSVKLVRCSAAGVLLGWTPRRYCAPRQ